MSPDTPQPKSNFDIRLLIHMTSRGEKYVGDIESILAELKKTPNFESHIKYIKEKLVNIPEGEDDRYIQAIAEIVLYLHYALLGYSVFADVKVNPDNKRDIDLQVCKEGLTLNFEIKCLNQDELLEDGTLHLSIDCRHPEVSKKSSDESISNFIAIITESSAAKIQKVKMKDNNILEYIKNANEKFSEPDASTLNILVIVADTYRMGDVIKYLCNPYSGLITTRSYASIDVSKIDYILVANIAEAHKKSSVFDFNVFNLKNFVNLFFQPPRLSKVQQFLFNTLPNASEDFAKYEFEYRKELQKADNGIEDDMITPMVINTMWGAFLSKYYSQFKFNKGESEQ